jgi:hypothetical protein
VYFLVLLVLTLLVAWQLARLWRVIEIPAKVQATPVE